MSREISEIPVVGTRFLDEIGQDLVAAQARGILAQVIQENGVVLSLKPHRLIVVPTVNALLPQVVSATDYQDPEAGSQVYVVELEVVPQPLLTDFDSYRLVIGTIEIEADFERDHAKWVNKRRNLVNN